MILKLIQTTKLPNGTETITTDTAPDGTSFEAAEAYFDGAMQHTRRQAELLAARFKCSLTGSLELVELVGDVPKRRRFETYATGNGTTTIEGIAK